MGICPPNLNSRRLARWECYHEEVGSLHLGSYWYIVAERPMDKQIISIMGGGSMEWIRDAAVLGHLKF